MAHEVRRSLIGRDRSRAWARETGPRGKNAGSEVRVRFRKTLEGIATDETPASRCLSLRKAGRLTMSMLPREVWKARGTYRCDRRKLLAHGYWRRHGLGFRLARTHRKLPLTGGAKLQEMNRPLISCCRFSAPLRRVDSGAAVLNDGETAILSISHVEKKWKKVLRTTRSDGKGKMV